MGQAWTLSLHDPRLLYLMGWNVSLQVPKQISRNTKHKLWILNHCLFILCRNSSQRISVWDEGKSDSKRTLLLSAILTLLSCLNAQNASYIYVFVAIMVHMLKAFPDVLFDMSKCKTFPEKSLHVASVMQCGCKHRPSISTLLQSRSCLTCDSSVSETLLLISWADYHPF